MPAAVKTLDGEADSHAPGSGLRYRAEVDGLRAIAVLSVIFFHTKLAGFSGGYVGVDVFFVISGFLISRILLSEIEGERFSVLRFYDRRIRRILPAFAAMAAVTAVAAVFLSLPLELERFGNSLAASALFASNLWFWNNANYFAAPAHTELLLHTWSLSVEEQFYILWPLLLWMLAGRLRRLYLPLCAIGVLVSLAVSEYAATRSPAAAFYLLPSRAWQLGLGALVASPSLLQVRNRPGRELLAASGLFLILYSVFAYDAATPFPGIHAFVPSMGAALLLHSGERTAVGALLSGRAIVFIGLISYSLYLWHWPLLALSRQYLGRELAALEVTGCLALCGVLAAASFRFVEVPFRRRGADSNRSTQWMAVRVATATLGVLLISGSLLSATKGLPVRGPESALAAESAVRESHDPDAYCAVYEHVDPGLTACRSAAAPPTIALWGDSHAGHLATELAKRTRATGDSVLFLIQAGCPPGVGADRVYGQLLDPLCRAATSQALRRIRGYPGIRTVVLAGRWSIYAENTRLAGDEGLSNHLTDDASSELTSSNSRRVLRESLGRALSELHGLDLDVLIIGQPPEFGLDTARCVARARWRQLPETTCFVTTARVRARFKAANAILDGLVAAHPGTRMFNPLSLFCDDTLCRSVVDGKVLYTDDDHLSLAGAEYVMEHVEITDDRRTALERPAPGR